MSSSDIYSVDEIRSILRKHNEFFRQNFYVKNFLLFGSYARNQQTSESDIDLLVNFTQPIDFFKFMDLQDYITGLFDKRIDLGTVDSLKLFIKDKILQEAIEL